MTCEASSVSRGSAAARRAQTFPISPTHPTFACPLCLPRQAFSNTSLWKGLPSLLGPCVFVCSLSRTSFVFFFFLTVRLKRRDVGWGPACGRFIMLSDVGRSMAWLRSSTTMRRKLPSHSPALSEPVSHTLRSLLLLLQADLPALSLLKTQNLKIIFRCVCSSRNIRRVCGVFWMQSLLETYFQTSLDRFFNDLQLAAKKMPQPAAAAAAFSCLSPLWFYFLKGVKCPSWKSTTGAKPARCLR